MTETEEYWSLDLEVSRFWASFCAIGLSRGWYVAFMHMYRVSAIMVEVNITGERFGTP